MRNKKKGIILLKGKTLICLFIYLFIQCVCVCVCVCVWWGGGGVPGADDKNEAEFIIFTVI